MKVTPYEHVIGIDEVGRGPLAGPLAIGAVRIATKSLKSNKKWSFGFRDSKKLSVKGREKWHLKIDEARKEGWLEYAVIFVSSGVIDKKGLSYAISLAIEKSLNAIKHEVNETMVLLDGGLHAPSKYINQSTIVKGDEKEITIALASIVAKVARDARMVKLAKKFPEYGFEKHKGYGTHAHYEAIKKNGITPHHRRSFLKGMV